MLRINTNHNKYKTMKDSKNNEKLKSKPLLSEVADIENHYLYACKTASELVEKMARKILSEHKELDEFVMAMGSYFFTYKSEKRKGDYLSPHQEKMNSSYRYYYVDSEPFLKPLNDFIGEWNDRLGITGDAMRFTAKGQKITDW